MATIGAMKRTSPATVRRLRRDTVCSDSGISFPCFLHSLSLPLPPHTGSPTASTALPLRQRRERRRSPFSSLAQRCEGERLPRDYTAARRSVSSPWSLPVCLHRTSKTRRNRPFRWRKSLAVSPAEGEALATCDRLAEASMVATSSMTSSWSWVERVAEPCVHGGGRL
jgi:hypothetical protein